MIVLPFSIPVAIPEIVYLSLVHDTNTTAAESKKIIFFIIN
jgi:hypothetical protein